MRHLSVERKNLKRINFNLRLRKNKPPLKIQCSIISVEGTEANKKK